MAQFTNDTDAGGRRVRLRPKPDGAGSIYKDGILNPLRDTNGLVFPYQPTISYQQEVNYTPVELVHTNQELYAYTRTNAVKLTVEGQFTVQNQTEGAYALACIHFLRTVTKMRFGESDPNAGTPPPVLLFDAYGQYMFNQLPVIVTMFSVSLPSDVDYVPLDLANTSAPSTAKDSAMNSREGSSSVSRTAVLSSLNTIANQNQISALMSKSNLSPNGSYVWLPAAFTISVSITVQNTPKRLRQFDLDQFSSGTLLQQGRWI